MSSDRSTSPPKSACPGVSTMLRRTPVVVDRRLLGEDRDALLALEVARIHDAVDDRLVRRGTRRSGGASRRRGWSCRGRRGRRWRRCGGRRGWRSRARRSGGRARSGTAPGRMGRPIVARNVCTRPDGGPRRYTRGHDRRRRDPVRHRRWRRRRHARPAAGPSARRPRLVRRRAADRRPRRPTRTAPSRPPWPGSEAVYGSPAPPEAGPVGQMVRGAELARPRSRDTTAVLLWPARMTWVGPETITSLIEAHGTGPRIVLRPAWHGEPGWPVLRPDRASRALRADRAGPDAARPSSTIWPRRSRPASSSSAIPASSTTSTRRRLTCRPTRARPIRRPATPTSGARTSPPKPVSSPPDPLRFDGHPKRLVGSKRRVTRSTDPQGRPGRRCRPARRRCRRIPVVRPATAASARGDRRARIDAHGHLHRRPTATSSTRRSGPQRRPASSCIRAGRSLRPPMRPRRAPSPTSATSWSSSLCRSTSPCSGSTPRTGHRRTSGDPPLGRGRAFARRLDGRPVRRIASGRGRRARPWASYSAADLSSDDPGGHVRTYGTARTTGVPNYTSPGQPRQARTDVSTRGHRWRRPRADGPIWAADDPRRRSRGPTTGPGREATVRCSTGSTGS